MNKISYQLAFDPGMVGCGYAIWENDKWFKAGTIIPKGRDHLTKLKGLQEELTELYGGLLSDPESYVGKVIIEDWEKRIPRHRIATMLKCSEG